MMYAQPRKNHLKNKHISCMGKGPILFTAPHSKKLNRGGKEYNERHRIHLRQIYTSFLTADVARHTGHNSYIVWGVTNLIDDYDMDPNYLMPQHFPDSPFHQALHHWALSHPEQALLHVDIHGKLDRNMNCEIDIGTNSIGAHWKNDPLTQEIKDFFSRKENIFSGLKFGNHEAKFEASNPLFGGYWKNPKIHTMTEQAILLGIPSIQIEIPYMVRKKLFRDDSLRAKFHQIMSELYKEVIVPDWKRGRVRKVSAEIGDRFISSVGRGKQEEQAWQQLKVWEVKEQGNQNATKKCI